MADSGRRGREAPASTLVIGLGRFGSAAARTLVEMGHEVLGIDGDEKRVAEHRDILTHVVEADSTDLRVLEQVGASDFGHAVVAIGADLEASVLTVAALVDSGVTAIWAKATTQAHARILTLVGAHHVIFPEAQMGERVAHLLAGRMLEYLPLDEGFALIELCAPPPVTGRSLGEIAVRARFGITVVCVKPAGGTFTYATPDTVLNEGDVIVVAGEADRLDRFSDMQ